ncbi:hypothetical protein [Urbifossiella limnaea]|uniref:Uncharacterized protein n=1 Tax=Urbifossiella limnaea TaxID=2528023 RepID=A0A517XTU8_9BACT|nr:hypothetical protein [Urbifossiella limnaea]QDU20936.1 hypothetical protein ETAA1_28990 [Urbifossiella limnaea]
MSRPSRRDALSDIGRGMFVATLGTGVAGDLGLGTAWADDEPARLTFGDLDPLVNFIHETPADRILPAAVEKLRTGTDLRRLVAAAALANARAFGGEDYVGFHTMMALTPAFHMAAEESDAKKRPLPVLKVLYRNAARLGEVGGPRAEVLRPVTPGGEASGERLRELGRQKDMAGAERAFAAVAAGPVPDAVDGLMMLVDDGTEVHRTVIVSRAIDLLDFVGRERAHTLLRQSVRYCVKSETHPNTAVHNQEVRALLPKVLDQHRLLSATPGTRAPDDAWVEHFADTVFRATPAQAADAVAAALAEGFSPSAVGEALALASNQLVLRDAGRPPQWAQANKPAGSCHGDSVGVHSCDSTHAWRTIARAGGRRTAVTSLILAGYQIARDRGGRSEFLTWNPYPRPEHLESVRGVAADALLRELDGAVREKNQPRAAALAHRIGEANPGAARDVFALLRGYAISEDGALHAEKYYRTVTEEFAAARPAFRWRQLTALARVTASAHGYPAPGVAQARELLKG